MAEICSRVIVLERGRVIAIGSPAEVLETCPWFAQFAASAGQTEVASDRVTVSDADDSDASTDLETDDWQEPEE